MRISPRDERRSESPIASLKNAQPKARQQA
jgi:hypothetical protein